MKKLFLSILALAALAVGANAQIIRTEDLEAYAKKQYGDKWVDAAANLGSTLELDRSNALTYVRVVEAPGQSATSLYTMINYWYTSSFADANSVINLNDKELGTIIGQGCLSNIAESSNGFTIFQISIHPIIRCDIKEGKVRITCTVPYYEANKTTDAFVEIKAEEKWVLDKAYPFAEKSAYNKRACSKSLIMSHAYANVIMDKLEECIKNGLTGSENDDW